MSSVLPSPTLTPDGGLVLIDKPTGWTSHDVVQKIRSITGIKRVGHAGTLDPLATGLLVVLIGRSWTKQQDVFLKQNKRYVCQAQLGQVSDTYDRLGQCKSSASPTQLASVSQSDIERALSHFRGEITQTVPAFSAVKRGGKKLYDLARHQPEALPPLPQRQVIIDQLGLVAYNPPLLDLEIGCSSGTYIRSLVADLGNKLQVGAVVNELRRTAIGDLTLNQAWTMDEAIARLARLRNFS